MSRFPKPALDVLTLANGDTITVRRQLTHGETTEMYGRMYATDEDGRYVFAEDKNTGARGPVVDPLKTGDAVILAYLVDWTFRDDDEAVIPIRGLSVDERRDVIRNLDQDSAVELRRAIEDHESRQRQKKTDARVPQLVAI